MKELRDVSIDDVRTLVAERQRYDDWLAALEAKRSETPSRVFERVYGDYFARRVGVTEQLREHVDALASLGDELEARIGELESQLATHEDERASSSSPSDARASTCSRNCSITPTRRAE